MLKNELLKAIDLISNELHIPEEEVANMPVYALCDVYVDIKNDEKEDE